MKQDIKIVLVGLGIAVVLALLGVALPSISNVEEELARSFEDEDIETIPDCTKAKEVYPKSWWLACPTPFPLMIITAIFLAGMLGTVRIFYSKEKIEDER